MPTPHASVNYVEPNLFVGRTDDTSSRGQISWALDDGYERAPRLEDYCIAVNIEVELSNRAVQTTSASDAKKVLLLQWRSDRTGDGQEISSTVNFMGGTKVATHDKGNHYMNYLTTNYADMYVEDLVDYGTTELIGIKSIDIQYEKSCVPIVTIQFTDVRGLSLFQPTELSRTTTYNSVVGLNADNVARSFFESFFKLPMPKFTIYIKGFYGKPVSYQVLCDKFETKFNSQTGDFDVMTRFIGYSYSFLTDISMDALLAAPFSDYVGKQYWEDQRKERFQLWNREKTERKPMPTLFEACMEINELTESGDTDGQETTLTEEEVSHTDEIATLSELRMMYQSWYELLFNICKAYYGKKYCFLMKEEGEDGDYTGLLLLVNNKVASTNMSEEYEQFPDNFKKMHSDLYAAIEKYNSSSNAYTQLENVSQDMRDYTRMHLFNDVFVNANNEYQFNGFSRENTLNATDVRDCIFNSHIPTNDLNVRNRNNERQRKYALQTIYNDGINQFTDCFFIGPNYSDIKQRINALQNDANRSVTEKEKEKKIKELNDHMYSKMSWYPSVENFTRIMMAHLETLMYMMFQVVTATRERTASQLGVTIGSEGICSDVKANVNANIVPPFPRVTSAVIESDTRTVKREDMWVGDFNNGEGFVEREMVDGLFNAVDEMQRIYKESQTTVSEITRAQEPMETGPIIKHPLAPFDFLLTSSPYGDANVISNDLEFDEFAGRVAIRMFNLLSINALRWQLGNKWTAIVKSIAESEAENFYEIVPITNRKFLSKLQAENLVSPQSIISAVTSSDESHPWGSKRLFSTSTRNMWLDGYRVNYSDGNATWIYPLQNYTFRGMDDSVMKIYNSGKSPSQSGAITISSLHNGDKITVLNKAAADENGSYMTTKVIEDISILSNAMNQSNSTAGSAYTEVYNILNSMVEPSVGDGSNNYFRQMNGPSSFVEKSDLPNIRTYTYEDGYITVHTREGKEYTYNSVTNYLTGAVNGNITSMFVVEIFGFDYDDESGRWTLNRNSSYYESYKKYQKLIDDSDIVAFYAMGIDVFDYAVLSQLLKASTFIYVPKLAILQMGAILKAANGLNNLTADMVRSYLPCAEGIGSLCGYLNSLSPMAKAEYIRVFNEFSAKYKATIKTNLLSESPQYNVYAFRTSNNTERRILREDNSYVHALTNNVMKLTCIAKLTVNHYDNMRRNSFALPQGVATTYLKAFLDRLKVLYSTVSDDSTENTQTKTTKTPSFTTKDMKKELYRYLKQLYDKWIPASSFEDWKMESFFDKSSEENGHTFYFIDSFYNNIGDKLLINPMKLSEKVNAFLEYTDVNSMLLGFMADMYAQNKCMFLCLQNFYDLNKIGSMADMFVPYSYEDAPIPNEYPSFVIVYPYEPSKNLDNANSEYTNDSFMLNDERETPVAITSREVNEDTYLIPAFGVTYGKQYQSFFTNVNVDMTAPVATQQSIKAKHYIIRKANDDVKKTTIAQDMYDIYTTQSYTCKVEMLGCPWVQPMMYFVLLNIPLFKGSYMIMSVTHRITPGNMVTEFTGCRMANVANSLVQNIFIGEDSMPSSLTNSLTTRNRLADVDNDCPYKVYPLFDEGDETQGSNVTTTRTLNERAADYHDKLVAYGLKSNAAWGVVGNLMQESTLDSNKVYMGDGGSAGLAQWHARYHLFRDMYDNRYAEYGHWDGKNKTGLRSPNDIKDLVKERSADYQLRFIVNSMMNNRYPDFNGSPLNELWTRDDISIARAATIFCNEYERPKAQYANISRRIGYAQKFAKAAGNQSTTTTTTANANADIRQAFFDAVQKSVNSTPSINVTLSKRVVGNFLYIYQQHGKTDKLGKVFDVILNGYYEYVNTLVWIYGKNALNKEPLNIAVIPSLSVQPNKRKVLVVEQGTAFKEVNTGGQAEYEINMVMFSTNDRENLSKDLRKALYKRYRGTNYEIPQFTDDAIFEGINIENCNDLMASSDASQIPSAGVNSIWAQVVRQMGRWYADNINAYSQSNGYDCPLLNGGQVRADCSGFISACLRMFGVLQSNKSTGELASRTNEVAEALRAKGFRDCDYVWEYAQPYDIVIKGGAHGEILAEKGDHPKSYGWGANHHNNMPCYADAGRLSKGFYKTIWRYVGS